MTSEPKSQRFMSTDVRGGRITPLQAAGTHEKESTSIDKRTVACESALRLVHGGDWRDADGAGYPPSGAGPAPGQDSCG
ncbi:unnamed protein product [Peniophora sp. CBMAI 1063]|nr:unnamed protein product [Peniophora sp. CBMAI 1063]